MFLVKNGKVCISSSFSPFFLVSTMSNLLGGGGVYRLKLLCLALWGQQNLLFRIHSGFRIYLNLH